MAAYGDYLKIPPYSLNKESKEKAVMARLQELTNHHYRHCLAYQRILDTFSINPEGINRLEDVPFLPVRLFKETDLRSTEENQIIKTITSSGTSGQSVSKIYLDRDTAANQQKTLIKIVSDFIGETRLPMVIIDCPSVIKDRQMFSARGAGILGFSIFGTDRAYALDDEMNLNFDALCAFIKKHEGKKILLFGFTFMVWEHFYKALAASGRTVDLSGAILIHGGGWKKLEAEAASPDEFFRRLNSVCGISRIYDYYGMAEQTGSIYMACEHGFLHASIFSDVLIRDYLDFSVCEHGERGIIQVLSMIPESYPGHSLLTEDEGAVIGEDDCLCGRKGKYFKVYGRIKNAELRGCSDTYASRFA